MGIAGKALKGVKCPGGVSNRKITDRDCPYPDLVTLGDVSAKRAIAMQAF
jgi:hypothetical protein